MGTVALGALGLAGCVAEVPPDQGYYGRAGYAYPARPYEEGYGYRHDVDRDRFVGERREEMREHCMRDPDDCRRF
jgi:hypothetical protein